MRKTLLTLMLATAAMVAPAIAEPTMTYICKPVKIVDSNGNTTVPEHSRFDTKLVLHLLAKDNSVLDRDMGKTLVNWDVTHNGKSIDGKWQKTGMSIQVDEKDTFTAHWDGHLRSKNKLDSLYIVIGGTITQKSGDGFATYSEMTGSVEPLADGVISEKEWTCQEK